MFVSIFWLTSLLINPAYAEATASEIFQTNIEASYFNPNATCGDFLREFDPQAPDYFKYDSCELVDDEQAKPIKVIYKIEGKYAKQAEHYLIEQFQIKPLRYLCCYWTTGGWPSGSFVNPKDNTSYLIGFSSDETLSAVDWSEITFYLVIEVFREDI